MSSISAQSPDRSPPSRDGSIGIAWRNVALAALAVSLLAGCATQPLHTASLKGSRYDPRLGVSASERVVADGDPVPRGGGSYLTGRPYVIGGRSYFPQQSAQGYTAVGMASWYGDAFHGRRTANGEVFDKSSISAAHPTLPLPSYVRVTNLGNGRSMVVRVNDRGPYHGSRVMDVSQRVADTLDFRRAGTARIRVEYIGRAALEGSDDAKLMATLRTDGAPAQLAGYGGGTDGEASKFTSLASAPAPAPPAPGPQPSRVARVERTDEGRETTPEPTEPATSAMAATAPLPPTRPFDVSTTIDNRSRGGRHFRRDATDAEGRQG